MFTNIHRILFIVVFLLNLHVVNCQTIHEACETGNFELVKQLIYENPLLLNNNTGQENRYPLHCAIRGKQIEIAKWLIEQGADVNVKDESGSSLLNYASYYGLTDIVNLLISKGAEVVNDKTQRGFTPLHMAILRNNIDVAKILIDNGIEVNDSSGQDPILMSSGRGNVEITKLLLDYGANVNARNARNNNTPLHSAAASGNVKLVQLLISSGADASINNNEGKSPMRIAAERGQSEVFKLLLTPNSYLNDKDSSFGMTTLHAAAICGSDEIVKILIDNKADVNVKDFTGNTPLFYAAKYGHKITADLLTAAGSHTEKLVENYGYSKELRKKIESGEAHIWYLGNCGFAVKTKTKLLIFDYWNFDVDPAKPLLANGHVTAEEISGLDVYVFVSHAHYDHFDKTILEWEKPLQNIKYIFGWNEYDNKYTNFNWTRGTKIIGDVEITYIPSDLEEEGAFFVAVDGLKIYHGGDYYYREVDSGNLQFLSDKYGKADIAFIECGFEHITENSISILNPSVMFPMHWRHNEMRYKVFADKVKEKYTNTRFICARNRGDNYFYSFGKINSN